MGFDYLTIQYKTFAESPVYIVLSVPSYLNTIFSLPNHLEKRESRIVQTLIIAALIFSKIGAMAGVGSVENLVVRFILFIIIALLVLFMLFGFLENMF